ncbi:hypothetical protein OH807_04725 [Kitasatospora sp. NBC_01560]|uniref:hypothetical protein n=1 Tax=Kitasatospora sp. NBC_01560 TaxID=2975965 RepID=UPI0038659AA6
MRTIEMLVPSVGAVDEAGLRAVDADELVRYVADPGHAWWRRRACAVALAGRVPERGVPGLLARVHDLGDTTEVRVALLDVLAGRPELAAWLAHEDRLREHAYGMPEAILKARGMLGDRSAAPGLATLAASPWPDRRAVGEAGLDGLVARHGAGTVLADLGDARPEDRIVRLRMRHADGADVTDALADPDHTVAYLAQSLLTDPDRLRDYLDEAPTTTAKLWAALALHRLTGSTAQTRAIHEALGRPRVEVAGLDDELRAAIVHEYAGRSERGTDPRWRVEALCTEPPDRPDQDEQLRRATAALTAAGLAPEAPVPAGEHNKQGDGTYHVIKCGENEVFLSTLGRFVTDSECDATAQRALESAGFRWIGEGTRGIRVTGLCVYYFGEREPLVVDTLVFHWQD